MKKILVMAIASTMFLVACSDSATNSTTTNTTDSAADANKTATNTTAYTPVEGDVKYVGKKVMVMKNGAWVEADADVKLDNGVTVYRDGRVERGEYEVELREGEIVNKTGDFFDNAGAAISNAWEATKEGVGDAGRAIKKGAKKAGDKIEDAVDGTKDNK